METQQLLDALTAHLSLYHRGSPPVRNPYPRKAILRWFSDLPLHQRRSCLTIVDRAFVCILLQMQIRTRTQGHGFFFLLPDIPSSEDPSLPTLCFRRSRGLLTRSCASNAWESSIIGGFLLFGSREEDDCVLDAATVTEELVGDVARFVEVMDGMSGGGFLCGEVDGLGSAWCELDWLKEKGYYSVAAFVANRLEVALRLSWLNSKGGKKKKGAKSRDNANALAAAGSVFYRKKACLDWFLGLDPGTRRKMVATYLRKGAKSLVKDFLNSSGSLKVKNCYLNGGLVSVQSQSCNKSYWWPYQLHCDWDFPMSLLTESFTTRSSFFQTSMVKVLILQQITTVLMAYENDEIEVGCLVFSTLESVQTIFDSILLRFRGILSIVARESMEHELVDNVSVILPSLKIPKEKLGVNVRCKGKCQNAKQEISGSRLPRADVSLVDPCMVQSSRSNSNMCKHTINVVQEVKSTNTSSIKHAHGSNKKDPFTANVGNASCNHPTTVSKRRNKRKGAACKKSSSKEMDKHENPTGIIVEKSPTVVSAENIESELNLENMGKSPTVVSAENIESELNLENTPLPVSDNDTLIKDTVLLQTSAVDLQNKSPSNVGEKRDKECILNFAHDLDIGEKVRQRNGQSEGENSGKDVEAQHCSSTWQNNTYCNSASGDEILEGTDASSFQKVGFFSSADEHCYSSIKELDRSSARSEKDNFLQSVLTNKSCKNPITNSGLFSGQSTGCPHGSAIPLRGKSYEWPNLSVHASHSDYNHLPAATDRYHLDVTYNWFNNLHPSYYSGRQQMRNSCIDHGCGQMMPSLNPPVSLDWPPMVTSNRLSQSVAPTYDSVYNTRLQTSLCTGIGSTGMQFRGGTSGDNEWKYNADGVGLPDHKKSFDFFEDTDSNWLSEDEYDIQTTNGRDYNKFFGGGIMYWNPSDHGVASFSRAPSHSSEDSSWAWYEADLNRAIDDMIDMPGFPTYSANGLASPTAGTFSSPFDGIGPGLQSNSHGYVISTTEVNKKVPDTQCPVAEVLEEKVLGSKSTSSGTLEGSKGDTLPYPVLRPIVIPSPSRKGSRAEPRYSHDHASPCVPSSRRDLPRIKRPPSPVVLCVPRSPRVPPPSPVGESRKHRGFPVVRSGSSSPRNWGVRYWHHEESNPEGTRLCMDGPEVFWASWGNKSLSSNTAVQPILGSLLQDQLIAISQLARDQDHPDVAFPLQPPDAANSPSRKASLSMMHSLLHEEINSFCKQVANENQLKKPYISWAVKRVAKSLQVLWPRSRTSIFGSIATGLALPTSDVDLVVCLPPVRNLEPIKEAGILEGRNGIKETCLQHAARYLANQEWVKNDSLKTIENTAIPLIMLVAEVPSEMTAVSGSSYNKENLEMASAFIGEPVNVSCWGHSISAGTSMLTSSSDAYASDGKTISLDISFKSPSHTGLRTTALVRELIEQFPASVPLALVLKQFLADRSLDRAYSGGLSSYCLVLLITRFLQHEHHFGRSLNQNIGSLLMDFLYFFGNVFDPRQMCVSIQGSGLYMTRERGHSIDPIHIDDPLCPTNNVGRNCFRIHQCIKAFADAYSILEGELSLFSGESGTCTQASVELLPKIIPSIGLRG